MENSTIPLHKLEIAAHNVDKSLMVDNNGPRLVDLLSINPQVGPSASGLTDNDYPTLSSFPLALSNMTQIKCVNSISLPTEIIDHFTYVQCHCMMGLFPEINRAWLTVDSNIYIWDYNSNTDLAYFDGINETIISVGLMEPKLGVFHAFIKYLLVVATSVDIIVLGITFTDGPAENTKEIQLIPDPVFTLSTDGLTVSVISGARNGRLFFGTKEGSLFEVFYQAESGWFGKRCKKINLSTSALSFLFPSFLNAALNEEDGISQISIDNSRHILYTLTDKGTIEVYDLGEKGTSFSKITKISQSALVNQAMNTVKTLDSQNFRPIVSISAVESYESANINLVAVSQTGVRFYFSVVSLSNLQPNQRPYTITLMHVRLPPGYSANITVRPRSVHMANYSDRNLLLVSTVNEKDVLWCMSSDLFPFSQSLMEAYTAISLDGTALAIAEVRGVSQSNNTSPSEAPPLIVRQHAQVPKKYVVLTSHGVQIFLKFRPVDILKQILKDSHGQDTELLRAFFIIQKEDQACATALILASLESEDNIEVADYATRIFFLFGGEPKLLHTSTNNPLSNTTFFSPNMISTPAHPHYQQYLQSATNIQGTPVTETFSFSAKHNGLYLYLSRILRPIWNKRCIEKINVNSTILNQSSLSRDDCINILINLSGLHNFLIRNTQLSATSSVAHQNFSSDISNNASLNVTRSNHILQDALLEERQSLDAFKVFVCHCCQIIGLWRILCEHQFHNLVAALSETHQQILQNITFKDLFLYRHDICLILIAALVDSYLGDNASVDSINNKLREVCPHLYKNEDAAFSKANEILKMTRTVQNTDEKEEMLVSALQICKTISPNINLTEVCKEFTALKAYKAVIELCVHYGKKIDPENIAEIFFNANDSSTDQEGFGYYQKRMEIYKHVLNMLDTLYSEENQNQVTSGTPYINTSSANKSSLRDKNGNSDLGSIMDQVINEILVTPDEILHIALYEWMVSKNLTTDLIKISNPSLETYLKRTSVQNADNITVMDLLWKYYETNDNHAAAAKILSGLASRPGTSVCLKDRLSYLARAIMCMRSDKVGYAPYLGVFLRDLEDKMEVAKVQEQILETMVNLHGHLPVAKEAIVALNSGLYEISQLYGNYAEPFKMLECQLAIIDCAGYTDSVLIESIWEQILTNELKKSSGSGTDRMGQVLTKIRQLARQYSQSTHCFPLEYIIHELELMNAKLKGDKSLVSTTFANTNIPFEKLITVYSNLITISLNDHFWQQEENEFHLCEATAGLINTFIDDHESYNSVEKRKITSLCQDTVASLFSNLYSKPNTQEFIDQLKSIQAKLSRI